MMPMPMDTVPSMLFMVATSCVVLAMMQKPLCKSMNGFESECSDVADLGFPAAGALACSAMCLCCMTHMGMLGRSSMMGGGMGGYGGGYGMF